MSDYNNFVQNNNKTLDNNCQNENSKLIEKKNENTVTNEPANDEKDHTINKDKNKVKHITVLDLSKFSDEDSDVEILKIVSPQKKNCSANDAFESESKTNEVNENIDSNSTTLENNKSSNNEVIHSAVGTWFISSNNNDVKSRKKKIHRDVENTFKIVETELKNKIDKSLKNINKVQVKQSSKVESIKRKEVHNDYLKMNKKRIKAEFNEPLLEDNKTLDTTKVSNTIDNPSPNNTNVKKSSKQVQNIDPTEFLQVTQTSLETDAMASVEDHLDDKDENEQEKLIAEAFADDDIVKEFRYFYNILLYKIIVHNTFFMIREEKKKIEEQSKPKIETALPGWGRWAGPNIRKRTFKKRANTGFFRTPAKPPRKDFNREKVIIHENANDAIKSHMVRFMFCH